MLIERAIPQLEEEANAILSRIAPGMSVQLATQRANKDSSIKETLDIIIADEMGTRPYENFSGGERFRIDFALRIALSKLLTHRAGARLETLIIDEGFGSQDQDGLARLLECLQAITSDFRLILVVSHLAEMTDIFPVRIEVTKGDSGSLVKVVG